MQVFVRIVTINCTEIYACNNKIIRLTVYTHFQRITLKLGEKMKIYSLTWHIKNGSIDEMNIKYFYLISILGSDM